MSSAWILLAPFIGGFLGLLIIRLPQRRAVVFGRSRCDHCGQPLTTKDLAPLVSAILLQFRCRYCSAKIDVAQFFAELAAIVVAVWAVLVAHSEVEAMFSCLLGWLLLPLALIDWRHHLLPNALTLALLFTGLFATAVVDWPAIVEHVLAAAAGFVLLYGVATAFRIMRGVDGLGIGDAKLLGAIGAWVSFAALPIVVFLAAIIGLAVAGFMSIFGGRVTFSTKLPFGTFLAAGGWLVWLYARPAVI